MSKNTRRTGTIAALVGAAALIAPAFAHAAPTGSPRLRRSGGGLHVFRDVD
ncbi:hypothetical protein LRL17_32610 (plasmid) [Rhodococcus qingshengii]|nr:hypothetical protein [Rhodococcus qingshengii]UGQ55648.1 hypothetical protein LRL17_32610 [Rhodococcus qingshengii]